MVAVEKQLTETMIKEVPRKKWRKAMFKTPLHVWRLGLKNALPPNFASITTIGRKSGLPRYTMVEYSELDGNFFIVSGWQDKPHWVKNLLVNPQITIQPVHGEPVSGIARRVQDAALLSRIFEAMQTSPMWKPWLDALGIQPEIGDFLAHKEQVYIFQITPDSAINVLPSLEEDLRWVPWLVIGLLTFAGIMRFVFKIRNVLRKASTKPVNAQ
jgi:deazaflavin-dependent oxidoreductase (nitroreductase family)